ncbi:MAG: hypothetical protein K2P80_13325 [Beijerinckiaceae bacterium]|nr:hypothetical protein [Beijerinckiaceae bacterium]
MMDTGRSGTRHEIEVLAASERYWLRLKGIAFIPFFCMFGVAYLHGPTRDQIWIIIGFIVFFALILVATLRHRHFYIELKMAEGMDRKNAVRDYDEKHPSGD